MKKVLFFLSTLVAVIMIASLVLPMNHGQAQTLRAPENPQDGGGVVSNRNVQNLLDDHVWTEAEMAAAKPYPLENAKSGSHTAAPTEEFFKELASKTPGEVEALMPQGMRNNLLDSPLPTIADSPSGYGYPAPYTRYLDFSNYKKSFPQIAIGRLFFYQGGYAYSCSAASIGNYAIWTAGHCVNDGTGNWSYGMIFVPGYYNGKAQAGVWKASVLWSLNDWIYYGDTRYDMGGAVLYTTARKKISQRVGALGFAWNQSFENHWFGIGYPAGSPFYGSQQVVCAASYAWSDGYFGSPYPTAIGCDQTGGTSGGPWIWEYGSHYHVNGHMDYRWSNEPEAIYSPYFGDAAYALYYALVTDYP